MITETCDQCHCIVQASHSIFRKAVCFVKEVRKFEYCNEIRGPLLAEELILDIVQIVLFKKCSVGICDGHCQFIFYCV
jgi:hypothetical protein